MEAIPIPEYSTINLLKEAFRKIGYTIETLVLGGSNYTRFVSPSGKSWLTANIHITYPFATAAARTISDNKMLAYELVSVAGYTIPTTELSASDANNEARIFKMLQSAPLIVKPDNASLSRGLTLNISTKKQLTGAIQKAREFSENVLVQQQLSGEEIRFVVMDGEVGAAVLRRTPRVVGDGVHTIGELLREENDQRRALKLPYLEYPLLEEPLIDLQAHDPARIPGEGEVVELSRSTMIRGGASVYDIADRIHPSYLQTAHTLALMLGQGFVVVDLFIDDYTKPQTSDNYAFIEFNMSPVIKLFYSCRDGKHYDILIQLVALIDDAISQERSKRV